MIWGFEITQTLILRFEITHMQSWASSRSSLAPMSPVVSPWCPQSSARFFSWECPQTIPKWIWGQSHPKRSQMDLGSMPPQTVPSWIWDQPHPIPVRFGINPTPSHFHLDLESVPSRIWDQSLPGFRVRPSQVWDQSPPGLGSHQALAQNSQAVQAVPAVPSVLPLQGDSGHRFVPKPRQVVVEVP